MRFLAKVLMLLFAASLASFVLLWHVQSILGSADNVDHVLSRSGAYTDLAQIIGQSFKTDIAGSQDTTFGANITAGISSAVNAPLISQIIQPTVKDLITWLNSSAANAPDLTLDTSAAKSAIATNAAQSSGDSSTLADSIRFDVQRLLPDSITITGQAADTGSTSAGQTSPTTNQGLNQLRSAYQSLKRKLVFDGIITILLGGLLLAVSWRNRRRALRHFGEAFILAAVFVLVIVYPIRLILTHTIFKNTTASSVNQLGLVLAHNLSNYLLLGLLPYAIGLAVIGAAFFGLGMVIPGASPDKKLKPKSAQKAI